jgi:hypothetical protein
MKASSGFKSSFKLHEIISEEEEDLSMQQQQ